MVDVVRGGGLLPPAEVEDVELYHPHSWLTKYVFCRTRKLSPFQYSLTATAIGLGSAGAVVADAASARLPLAISPSYKRTIIISSSPCTA
ncbi:MAG: hypothetical protein WDN69_02530 [Aliidongia sp.]